MLDDRVVLSSALVGNMVYFLGKFLRCGDYVGMMRERSLAFTSCKY